MVDVKEEAEERGTSVADRLRAQGHVQGLKEGERKVLMTLLRARFGILSDPVKERIRSADRGQIERWATSALSARSLNEVLDKP